MQIWHRATGSFLLFYSGSSLSKDALFIFICNTDVSLHQPICNPHRGEETVKGGIATTKNALPADSNSVLQEILDIVICGVM